MRPPAPDAMPIRPLGRTGHESSLAIFGCAALWEASADEAGAALERVVAAGVNHLDVAPRYGNAQRALGPSLPALRDRLFVACKTMRPDAGGARAELEESLSLLGCETFDLYQLHAVTTVDELDRRRGAVEALRRARDDGLVRYLGITGHDMTVPAAHLEALRRYDFDTVMFPVNPRLWADDAYRRDAEALLAHCAERDVGVMAIKAGAHRPWGEGPRWATTWYEPHRDLERLVRGVRFALSVPGVHAVCTPGDLDLLPAVLDACASFAPMDEAEREAAVAAAGGEPLIFPLARHTIRP